MSEFHSQNYLPVKLLIPKQNENHRFKFHTEPIAGFEVKPGSSAVLQNPLVVTLDKLSSDWSLASCALRQVILLFRESLS